MLAAPAKLTGDLKDPVWEKAATFKMIVTKTGAPAKFNTEVRLFCTADALYIGVTLDDPDPANAVVANAFAWQNDSIELFVYPGASCAGGKLYYQSVAGMPTTKRRATAGRRPAETPAPIICRDVSAIFFPAPLFRPNGFGEFAKQANSKADDPPPPEMLREVKDLIGRLGHTEYVERSLAESDLSDRLSGSRTLIPIVKDLLTHALQSTPDSEVKLRVAKLLNCCSQLLTADDDAPPGR